MLKSRLSYSAYVHVLVSIWFKISIFGAINTVTSVLSVVLFMLVHFH